MYFLKHTSYCGRQSDAAGDWSPTGGRRTSPAENEYDCGALYALVYEEHSLTAGRGALYGLSIVSLSGGA